MSTERLCVIGGCRQLRAHAEDCDSERCKGCLPRHVEHGLVCNSDRSRLEAELADIATLYADLVAEPDLVDRSGWTSLQWRPIPTSDPVRRASWLWVSEPGEEPLAKVMPMGITRNGLDARVSGSKEAPIPVNLDRLDLTADVRPAQRALFARGVLGMDPDQVGTQSAATVLDGWVTVWRDALYPQENLPVPTVPELVRWLSNRLPDACDRFLAIDEYAEGIRELRTSLRRVLELNAAPKERCEGVYCKGCDRLALYREDGLVTCNYCGLHYSEGEYREWVGLLAGQARRMAA